MGLPGNSGRKHIAVIGIGKGHTLHRGFIIVRLLYGGKFRTYLATLQSRNVNGTTISGAPAADRHGRLPHVIESNVLPPDAPGSELTQCLVPPW